MHKVLHFVFYVSFATLCGCKVNQGTTTNTAVYSQDLSQYRVHFEPKAIKIDSSFAQTQVQGKSTLPPNNQQTEQINETLDLLPLAYEQVEKTNGYRIQFYSGKDLDEAKRRQAEVRIRLREMLSDRVFIEYKQPYYKVKMGNYLTRLEVYRMLKNVQTTFSDAQAITDEISLRDLRKKLRGEEELDEDEQEDNGEEGEDGNNWK